MPEIIDALRSWHEQGRRAALATVVHITGSAYRREAAKMLVAEDGESIGVISGGCLEDDVRQAAQRALAQGAAELLHYDMTADDDIVWGLGLGCNGTVDVFVEPLAAADAEKILAIHERDERVAVVTVVAGNQGAVAPGQRLFIYPDRTDGTLGDAQLDALVTNDARALIERGESRSFLYTYDDGQLNPAATVRERKRVLQREQQHVQVYIETMAPPPTLLVLGGGHDAIPVVQFGRAAGFRVVVVDSRRAYATPERFPDAAQVIHAHPSDFLEHVKIDRFTYAIVMTHNYNHDRDLLVQVWGRPYAYLGVLGPWDRTSQLLDDLRKAGIDADAHLDRLYSPIGLNVGAEGAEQIAIAIIAEILAVKNGREPRFLRFHKGSIHDMASD